MERERCQYWVEPAGVGFDSNTLGSILGKNRSIWFSNRRIIYTLYKGPTRQYPIIKGIMGLRELAFGFQLAYDFHRDLRPFAVLQLMDAIVQQFHQALPGLRHLF